MRTMTDQMVKHEGLRKISHPMMERTHCPQKYVSRMSSTQGQFVHMKKKRIAPHASTDEAELWKNLIIIEKNQKVSAAQVLMVVARHSSSLFSLEEIFCSSFSDLFCLFSSLCTLYYLYLNFESTGPDLPGEYVDRIVILLLFISSQKFVSLLQQFSCSPPFYSSFVFRI